MLRGAFEDAGDRSPRELQTAYRARLGRTIEDVGIDTVVDQSGLDEETIRAVSAGEPTELALSEAAAILATEPDLPDAETIAADARDILLLGMTTAVLDVEALASRMNDAFEPREIQQMVEGRHPITLEEYAKLHHQISAETG